jgi:hypothetical protein
MCSGDACSKLKEGSMLKALSFMLLYISQSCSNFSDFN